MVEWLSTNWVEVIAVIGGAVTLASLIVKLTPTPKDDTVLASIIGWLKALGLYKKGT